jgi:hypothetical protein
MIGAGTMLEPNAQTVHADQLGPKQPLTREGSAPKILVTAHTALLLLKRDCGAKILQILHQKIAPFLQNLGRFESCYLFLSTEERAAIFVTLWTEACDGPAFSTVSRTLRALEPVAEGVPWTQHSRISETAAQQFSELSAEEGATGRIAACHVSRPLLERIKALSSGILAFHKVRT